MSEVKQEHTTNVLKGTSPSICPLKAQLVDEILGLVPPREKKVKPPEPGDVRKCRKAEGSKSRYVNMWQRAV